MNKSSYEALLVALREEAKLIGFVDGYNEGYNHKNPPFKYMWYTIVQGGSVESGDGVNPVLLGYMMGWRAGRLDMENQYKSLLAPKTNN